jgi:four helix bundle protein
MTRIPFPKLLVWQKSMNLVTEIYKITLSFPKDELYTLTSQLRRCAISVPSNIAEGSQRQSDKDFSNFLGIARGSLAEAQTQLLIAEKLGYVTSAQNSQLQADITEIQKMLHSFQSKLPSRF